jgi:protein ImuB
MYACLYSTLSSTSNSLLSIGMQLSPLVEVISPHAVLIDISGCETLFGTPDEFCSEVLKSADALGLEVNIAMGFNADACIIAGRHIVGITTLKAGEERTTLGPLRLSALDPALAGINPDKSNYVIETLQMWGLNTLGELADLPEEGVAETLGPEGLKLQKLARGTYRRHLNFVKQDIEFKESLDLDSPIELLEQLGFVVSGLIHQLCSKTGRHGFAISEIIFLSKLDDGRVYDKRLQLPFPMAQPKWLCRLLLYEIESAPPPAAIKSITLEAKPAKYRTSQEGLFDPLAPEPEKLEVTLAKLSRLVGRENVGAPELLDDHRPDSFTVKCFTLPRKLLRKIDPTRKHKPKRSSLGFKVFRPPLAAEVRMDSGRLLHLKSLENQRRLSGRIVYESGPWKSSGEWWCNAGQWARDEWDIALVDGTIYKVFKDLNSGDWFVEGVYD